MGCCESCDSVVPIQKYGGKKRFNEEDQARFEEIIKKGPLIPVFPDPTKQAESLPKDPFQVYDDEGNEAEFLFETEGIFSNPADHPEKALRVFYDEIKSFKIQTIPGYSDAFFQLTLNTKLGVKSFFFFPRRYNNCITEILKS